MNFSRLFCILCFICLPLSAVLGQGFGARRIIQNNPPATEFIAARWHFGTNGYKGNMGWSHNYPQSDRSLNDFLKRATRINLEESSFRIVELGGNEVFDYPLIIKSTTVHGNNTASAERH